MKRRTWFLPMALVSPCLLCLGWIGFFTAYEAWELSRLTALVDEAALPGRVKARDGRNDLPSWNSNGAFVRVHWLVQTEDPARLRAYAERLVSRSRARFDGLEYVIRDAGPIGGDWVSEDSTVHEGRLCLLRLSYGRGNLAWEISD